MGRRLLSRGWLIGAAVIALIIVIVVVGVFVVRPGPFGRSSVSAANVGGPCASAPERDATITGGYLEQFTIHPIYADVLRYARDAAHQPLSARHNLDARRGG